MKAVETLQLLKSGQADALMGQLYGSDKAGENKERYCDLVAKFKAVSYTHLDVYKRQAWRRTRKSMRIPFSM